MTRDEGTDAVAHNRAAWDRLVADGDEWTRPVSAEVIAAARAGKWSVVLIGHEPVPREWFPTDMRDQHVLCLASGGGQQAPVLAAGGARITSLDNSPRQLEQDRLVAERDGLEIGLELGDMRDLSRFDSASFNLVFNPVSNLFCPDIDQVWRECYRVLRPGGLLLAGFMNPDIFIFDREANDSRGELVVRHALPYSDLTHLAPSERDPDEPLEFSHTLGAQIGGQLDAGFVITGFREAPHHADASARYMSGYFATRALKPVR
ncbi:MAG TPA: class I SAM-dependent methyltransferase [Dehalococcoidia bacterium]